MQGKEFNGKKLHLQSTQSGKVDFDIYMKVPKSMEHSNDVWIDLFRRVIKTCVRYFALSGEKPYATEIEIIWIKELRKLHKKAKDFDIKSEIKKVIVLIEQNFMKIDKLRSEQGVVPKDFLGKRTFVMDCFAEKPDKTKKLKGAVVEQCGLVVEKNKNQKDKQELIKMKVMAEKESNLKQQMGIEEEEEDFEDEEVDEGEDGQEEIEDNESELDEELEEEDLGESELEEELEEEDLGESELEEELEEEDLGYDDDDDLEDDCE